MNNKISKDYIECSEIDKYIHEDKELYDNLIALKEQTSEVNADRISFAMITIIINIIQFLLRCKPPPGLEAYRILDNKMSNIIGNLVNDMSVKVYMFKADVVNAFNVGTSDIYYTDKLVKLLRLTEGELIGVCLHEYGHYAGGHMKTVNITNTATGIVIPILIREITRSMESIYSLILGKIIAAMVNSYLRIIIGKPQEYFSDSYAAKKGYGPQLISVLKKLDQYVRKIHCKDKSTSECDIMMEYASKYDEHPTVKLRVDNILNNSKIASLINGKRFGLLVRFLDRIKGFFRR